MSQAPSPRTKRSMTQKEACLPKKCAHCGIMLDVPGRGVCLLCHQRTHPHALAADACFTSYFNLIRYWAW
jgi:hypothetical protein